MFGGIVAGDLADQADGLVEGCGGGGPVALAALDLGQPDPRLDLPRPVVGFLGLLHGEGRGLESLGELVGVELEPGDGREILGQRAAVVKVVVEPGGLLIPGEGEVGAAKQEQGRAGDGLHPGGLGGPTLLLEQLAGVGESFEGERGAAERPFDLARRCPGVGQPPGVVQVLGQRDGPLRVRPGLFDAAESDQGPDQREPGVGLVVAVDGLREQGEGLAERLDRVRRPVEPQLGLGDQEEVEAGIPRVVALQVDPVGLAERFDRRVVDAKLGPAKADGAESVGLVAEVT